MKKKIIAISLALLSFMSVSAYADEREQIGDTGYYSQWNDDTYTIYNPKGEVVSENIYTSVIAIGSCFSARAYSNSLCAIIDSDFNTVTDFKYDYIDYNENTNIFECHYAKNVDFYNSEFEKVSQPRDIRKLYDTDYYYESIIDEKNANNTYCFICNKDGDRLDDEGYREIKAYNGYIVVTRFSTFEMGLYDSSLELVTGKFYDKVYFNEDTNLFSLIMWDKDDLGNSIENTLYIDVDGKKSYPVEKIENTNYYISNEDEIFYICDEKGNHIFENEYYEVIPMRTGHIKVRSTNIYPYKYGLLDENLNPVVEEKYYDIIPVNSFVNDLKAYNEDRVYYFDENYNIKSQEEADIKFVIPIEGLEGKYVYDLNPYASMSGERAMIIIDDYGNPLTKKYMNISPKVLLGGTVFAQEQMGMADSLQVLLDGNLNIIVPPVASPIEVKEENSVIYAELYSSDVYYDLSGNKYGSKSALMTAAKTADTPSKWSEESINKAVENGIVPKKLQSKYTLNITREEFCELAMETYSAITGYTIDEISSPFTDTYNKYISHANKLGIVAGTGDEKFSPYNNITRQEAAVMLNNLAKILNISITGNKEKFIDENYFADWAKESIYNISGLGIMVGTEPNKFSPWMNYTREQAIVTLYRLYNV